MAGVIFFPAGSQPCFEKDTVVQPDNQFPIAHAELTKQYASGHFAIEGRMPAEFPEDLARAVKASVTMSSRQQRRLLDILHL